MRCGWLARAVTGVDGAIRSGRGGRRTRQSCVRLQWVVAGDRRRLTEWFGNSAARAFLEYQTVFLLIVFCRAANYLCRVRP